MDTGSTRAVLEALHASASSMALSDKPTPLRGVFQLIFRHESSAPLPSHMVGELTLKVHAVLSSVESHPPPPHAAHASRDALEKLVLSRLYTAVFGAGDGDAKADAALHAKLAQLQPLLTPARLGVAAPFCEAEEACWAPAVQALRQLEDFRAPKDKVTLIVNCCRLIERQLQLLLKERRPKDVANVLSPSIFTSPVGADEFFPVLVYVVLQANPERLHSHLAFIARFRNPEMMRGMQGCYFTHLRAAAHFLQHLTCNDDGHEIVTTRAPTALGDEAECEAGQVAINTTEEIHSSQEQRGQPGVEWEPDYTVTQSSAKAYGFY
ncbi:hypothetical protein AB1Y20_003676 [Prymnesium parvum]|uniref:VPS9 domain-containing protein n=1 Tax=Prymnesium parvum TaxID=97485 RepID=A0AB34J5B0_PRYPA